MGKFSGVLLASDFDDTLVPTSALRAQGLSVQGTSPENCAALTYFTENGGRFTISTGRSAATFAPYAAQLPLNAPAVVSGGGALYDYSTGRYCMMTHLPPCAAADLSVLAERFPAPHWSCITQTKPSGCSILTHGPKSTDAQHIPACARSHPWIRWSFRCTKRCLKRHRSSCWRCAPPCVPQR